MVVFFVLIKAKNNTTSKKSYITHLYALCSTFISNEIVKIIT